MLSSSVRVLDGGLASTLQGLGMKIDGDPLWSARLLHINPNAIREVHSKFLEAGASVLITASYQASIEGFMKHLGLSSEESMNLIKLSVQIAKDARDTSSTDRPVLVAGSVGPYGACLADGSEYTGSYMHHMSQEELMNWHKPRIEALISSEVDLLAVESFPALDEALCILKLIKNYPTVKAWVTFSCKNGLETNFGDNFGQAVKLCYEENSSQLVGIGINCTSPVFITSLLTSAAKNLPVDFPRVVYPNSGEDWMPCKGWHGKTVSVVEIVEKELETWLNLGVKVIGGCCRVGPDAIAAIARLVKERSSH